VARDVRRRRLRQSPTDDGRELRQRRPPHRGAAADAASLGPERDRERRQHGGAGHPHRRRRVLGEKFALAGWTDALYLEERPNGVHVGLVLPGYIATEGFPAHELREKALTRWTVSDAAKAADAIADAALHGRAERYVPRPYAVLAVARVLAPGLLRRLQASRAGALATTRTGADAAGR
jgi:NAD(P)-dependent dehydrogenase (short-subunit alcohol dehydrogenase family)